MYLRNKKILLTGGNGFLGTFVKKGLIKKGVREKDIFIPDLPEFDLRNKKTCQKVTRGQDIVMHLAAKVGGINFNKKNPATVFYDNAIMALNIIDASYKNNVKKFIGIGSACEYPKFVSIPFKEKNLWDGYPEETNAPYGLAKKFMLTQSRAYNRQYSFNAMHLLLTNMYGPEDNFNLNTSHVIPALIKKIADAKRRKQNYIEVWGTGKATREFLYVEDAARGIVLAAEKYNKPDPVNLGSGMEISIKDLVKTICGLMNFNGKIKWDRSKPNGQPRRTLDTSRAKREFSFVATTALEKGLKNTIEYYKDQYA